MPDMPDSTGRRIARRRHILGLKQRELAERVGVARDTVSMWERDEQFPHRHLGKLEAVLGINLLPNGPEIDPHLQAILDGLSPEVRALVVEQLTGQPLTAPDAAPASPARGRPADAGRHRRAG